MSNLNSINKHFKMDLEIKPDPDMPEDMISEFLDENRSEQNVAIASEQNRDSNIDQKFLHKIIGIGSSNFYEPTTPYPQASAVTSADVQQKAAHIFLSSLPYDPTRIVKSTDVTPTEGYPSNMNNNIQQNAILSSIQINSGAAIMPNEALNRVPCCYPSSARYNPGHQSQNALSTKVIPTGRLPAKIEQSKIFLHQLKQRVIDKHKTNKTKRVTNNSALSSHWKRKFIGIFEKDGCSTDAIVNHIVGNNFNCEQVIAFYNKTAKEAQDNVHEECDSLSFNNITEWLKYLNAMGISEQCNYEAAIVLNAIANNEHHPEPESMSGINLKAIYKFLSNALMGLPQQQLSKESATFLSNEFENLINEANTDEADNDVRDMKKVIEDSLGRTIHGKAYKLDPLNTNNEGIRKCYELLKK